MERVDSLWRVGADGTAQDFERWDDGPGTTNLGWGVLYRAHAPDGAALADTWARIGDFELINYSTSEGVLGSDGGPKTLKLAVKRAMEYADHTVQRYATASAGDVGNPNYLIDYRSELNGTHYVNDSWFALPNLYIYTVDPTTANYIKSVYMRTATDHQAGGTILAYPPSRTSNTYAWGGSAGTWPAIPFMFGQWKARSGHIRLSPFLYLRQPI